MHFSYNHMQSFVMVKKSPHNSHMSGQILRSWYGPHTDIPEEKTLLESSFSWSEVEYVWAY